MHQPGFGGGFGGIGSNVERPGSGYAPKDILHLDNETSGMAVARYFSFYFWDSFFCLGSR